MLEWFKTRLGYEAYAPYIEGSFVISSAEWGTIGFSVIVYYDCVRNGGQNQSEYEPSNVFKSVGNAKAWCQRYYDNECGLTQ